MPRFERPCHSLQATEQLAADLSAVLRAGDIVRLQGDMGAGKTTLVRALAQRMGVDADSVTSPTYTLMNLYETRADLPNIAHLDCYRLGSSEDLDALGWDRVTDGSMIVVVEWPERIDDTLPADAASITITPIGEHARLFAIQAPDAWDRRAGFFGLENRPDTICPVTGKPVPGDSASWPFSDERARLSDLHGWISGSYTISRPIEQRDLEEE